MNEAMKDIDMNAVRAKIEGGVEFTLPIPISQAPEVLEELGLILNPKSGTYESLEEGDRWKIEEKESGILVSPDPILYDTGIQGTPRINVDDEARLEEDEEVLKGLRLDSPEGKGLDAPSMSEGA
jgi:hypothetical protein